MDVRTGNFVAGRRGVVVEDDFYNKLDRLSVQAGKKDKTLAAHVQRICRKTSPSQGTQPRLARPTLQKKYNGYVWKNWVKP